MPVLKVREDELPKVQRKSKVSKTSEYQEIQELLPSLKKGEALRVSISDKTIKDVKFRSPEVAIASFRQKLSTDPEYKSKFRISVVGNEILIRHRSEERKR